jgi:hypothetical protein
MARLLKFRGRCVLGFQSIAQVSGTYGRAASHYDAQRRRTPVEAAPSASAGRWCKWLDVKIGLRGDREQLWRHDATGRSRLPGDGHQSQRCYFQWRIHRRHESYGQRREPALAEPARDDGREPRWQGKQQ